MKHTFEEKIHYVRLFLSGMPQSRICKQYHLGQHYLENLIDRYRQYGEDGLHTKKHNILNAQEKERLVRLFIEKGVTLRQICKEHGVSKTAFEKWVRMARTLGYNSLHNVTQRGRPPKDPMARPKKNTPQTELEKLQTENLRLRAEIALLKKVKTLVEEEEARARLNGQKPSTN